MTSMVCNISKGDEFIEFGNKKRTLTIIRVTKTDVSYTHTACPQGPDHVLNRSIKIFYDWIQQGSLKRTRIKTNAEILRCK